MQNIILRIVSAEFLMMISEVMLPDTPVSRSAKRVLLLIETAVILEPLARLIYGLVR